MMNAQDRDAMDNALLAIDASIRTLVLAKTVIEDRITAHESTEKPRPFETMGLPDKPACEHLNARSKDTLGQSWLMCDDCGNMEQVNDS